jgi:hypothetical protein
MLRIAHTGAVVQIRPWNEAIALLGLRESVEEEEPGAVGDERAIARMLLVLLGRSHIWRSHQYLVLW